MAAALVVSAGPAREASMPAAGLEVVATGVPRPLQLVLDRRTLVVLGPGARGDSAGEIYRVDLDGALPVDIAAWPRWAASPSSHARATSSSARRTAAASTGWIATSGSRSTSMACAGWPAAARSCSTAPAASCSWITSTPTSRRSRTARPAGSSNSATRITGGRSCSGSRSTRPWRCRAGSTGPRRSSRAPGAAAPAAPCSRAWWVWRPSVTG